MKDWKKRVFEVAMDEVKKHCPRDSRYLEEMINPAFLRYGSAHAAGTLALDSCLDKARIQVLEEQAAEIARLRGELFAANVGLSPLRREVERLRESNRINYEDGYEDGLCERLRLAEEE